MDVEPRASVLCLARDRRAADWLASSLAVRLSAVAFAPHRTIPIDDVLSALDGVDLPRPLAIIGEADAASVAVEAARAIGSRLALLYPADVDEIDPTGVPTTLIQAAATGPNRDAVVRLERALRGAGVAVRETEYDGIADGWARKPRRRAGSSRALDDLVAFLDRGIGQASTFDVIPGWDLH